MQRSHALILVIGTTVMTLSSCLKDEQTAPRTNAPEFARIQAVNQVNTSSANGYEPGSIFQIELSANIAGKQGGGVWLWIGLHTDGKGDYSGADCGHGGAGALNDKGDATWHYSGLNNDSVVINGVILNGLEGFPTTITVPSRFGHYTGTIGTFLTLPDFIPPFIGFSQLQVAP
jgi:hypothetical protein